MLATTSCMWRRIRPRAGASSSREDRLAPGSSASGHPGPNPKTMFADLNMGCDMGKVLWCSCYGGRPRAGAAAGAQRRVPGDAHSRPAQGQTGVLRRAQKLPKPSWSAVRHPPAVPDQARLLGAAAELHQQGAEQRMDAHGAL